MRSLAKIYDDIFENSPQNAISVFNTLYDLVNSLSDERFEYSKELIINKEKFRFISKWSYKIIYERKKDKVIIIDVFGSRQNPNKILEII